MLDRSQALLWDVANAIREIRLFLNDVDDTRYQTSSMLQAAVERKLQIVGEACAQLSKVAPEAAAGIPNIRQIVGFRNVLVHGYASLENITVYEIATQRLPELEMAVIGLLSEKT